MQVSLIAIEVEIIRLLIELGEYLTATCGYIRIRFLKERCHLTQLFSRGRPIMPAQVNHGDIQAKFGFELDIISWHIRIFSQEFIDIGLRKPVTFIICHRLILLSS